MHKSSRWGFLRKFSANKFGLSDAEDNNSGPLHRKGIADLCLLRRILAIHQKSLGLSDRLFYFISLPKFGSFKNPFATINTVHRLWDTGRDQGRKIDH